VFSSVSTAKLTVKECQIKSNQINSECIRAIASESQVLEIMTRPGTLR